jgi:hypothetical protein
MATARKRLVLFVVAVGFWFLAADAYLISKERAYENCTLTHATELVKTGREVLSFSNRKDAREDNELVLYRATQIVSKRCKTIEGGVGHWWDSVRGMAYWEIILLAPVAYRFHFD